MYRFHDEVGPKHTTDVVPHLLAIDRSAVGTFTGYLRSVRGLPKPPTQKKQRATFSPRQFNPQSRTRTHQKAPGKESRDYTRAAVMLVEASTSAIAPVTRWFAGGNKQNTVVVGRKS